MTSTEKWRHVPKFNGYRLSDGGRVVGQTGKMLRPFLARKGSPETAAYYLTNQSGKTIKILIRTLMREAWDVADFAVSAEWVAAIRSEAEQYRCSGRKPVARVAHDAPPPSKTCATETEPVQCSECQTVFDRPTWSARTTCSANCQKKKRRRAAVLACPYTAERIAVDYYDMQTLCQDYPSWDCPAMDPLTNRMEPGVWIDVPAATPAIRRTAA